MSHPMEPFESQNKSDDDGPVIDSLFIETDDMPDLAEAQEPILVRFKETPAKETRIFSGDLTLGTDWDVVQILPADVGRKSLNIYVYSPTAVAVDGVRISDDPGMVRTAGKVLHSGTIDLGSHTGPVYVFPVGANGAPSAAVSIQYWSVSAA